MHDRRYRRPSRTRGARVPLSELRFLSGGGGGGSLHSRKVSLQDDESGRCLKSRRLSSPEAKVVGGNNNNNSSRPMLDRLPYDAILTILRSLEDPWLAYRCRAICRSVSLVVRVGSCNHPSMRPEQFSEAAADPSLYRTLIVRPPNREQRARPAVPPAHVLAAVRRLSLACWPSEADALATICSQPAVANSLHLRHLDLSFCGASVTEQRLMLHLPDAVLARLETLSLKGTSVRDVSPLSRRLL